MTKAINVIAIIDNEIATRNDASIAFKAAGDRETSKMHAEERDDLIAARWAILELIAAAVNYRHQKLHAPAIKRFDAALETVGAKV